MKTLKYLLAFFLLSASVIGQNLNSIDAMFVIDNSGSMKKNDPGFLLNKTLTMFVQNQQDDTDIGFILFSDKVDVFISLIPLKVDTAKSSLKKIINYINYSGKYTNSPSAIEKAYYELKTNGRKGCDKIIIFLTDGIVDLENYAKNDEKSRWLKEVIADDCKTERIRIFSIAFTEQADFELLQTLSSKTGGCYYRALNAIDIPKIFDNISTELKRKADPIGQTVEKIVPITQAIPNGIESQSFSNFKFYIIAIAILFVFVIIAIILINYKKKKSKSEILSEELPEAYLVDISGITNKGSFQIRKRITRIGRVEANDLYIPDENNFVSSFHAIIEFKDHNFYVIDQDSVNGTFVNGTKIEKKENVVLKGGDEISFDKFAFKFLCPVEGERGQTVLNMGNSVGNMTIQHLPDDIEKINE